jgi:DNA polymerase I-like protein with 3'-5' exonuclease and polymerase domains
MEVAQRIQTALENAVSLAVQLPVKMKIGDTWGSLKEITL